VIKIINRAINAIKKINRSTALERTNVVTAAATAAAVIIVLLVA